MFRRIRDNRIALLTAVSCLFVLFFSVLVIFLFRSGNAGGYQGTDSTEYPPYLNDLIDKYAEPTYAEGVIPPTEVDLAQLKNQYLDKLTVELPEGSVHPDLLATQLELQYRVILGREILHHLEVLDAKKTHASDIAITFGGLYVNRAKHWTDLADVYAILSGLANNTSIAEQKTGLQEAFRKSDAATRNSVASIFRLAKRFGPEPTRSTSDTKTWMEDGVSLGFLYVPTFGGMYSHDAFYVRNKNASHFSSPGILKLVRQRGEETTNSYYAIPALGPGEWVRCAGAIQATELAEPSSFVGIEKVQWDFRSETQSFQGDLSVDGAYVDRYLEARIRITGAKTEVEFLPKGIILSRGAAVTIGRSQSATNQYGASENDSPVSFPVSRIEVTFVGPEGKEMVGKFELEKKRLVAVGETLKFRSSKWDFDPTSVQAKVILLGGRVHISE